MYVRLSERSSVVSHNNIDASKESLVYQVVLEHLGKDLTDIHLMRTRTIISEKNNKEFDLSYDGNNLGKIICDTHARNFEATIHFFY